MSDTLQIPGTDTNGHRPLIFVGGTFDPPHRAHTELAEAARRSTAPDADMVFVPAARSPHKAEGPSVTDADRLAMIRLATAGMDRASVWTDELDRAPDGEPSYWVTTLERARAILGPERPMMFLIGADQAASFDRWREPGRILELADPIVINRGAVSTRSELAEHLGDRAHADRLLSAWCEVPALEISSTDVRRSLAVGDVDAARWMLHPAVLAYITEHGLYRSG